MNVVDLNEKRFEAAKQDVYLELVTYFKDLDLDRKSWYLILAIKSHAQSHHYSISQAGSLVSYLCRHYGIREASIQTALAFNIFHSLKREDDSTVVGIGRCSLSQTHFDMLMWELAELENSLEYHQALALTVLMLNCYPGCKKK